MSLHIFMRGKNQPKGLNLFFCENCGCWLHNESLRLEECEKLSPIAPQQEYGNI